MERLQAEETLTAVSIAQAAVPITQTKDGSWRRALNERKRWIEHLEKIARGPQPKPEPVDAATILLQARLAGIPVEVVPPKKKE